MTIPHKLKTVLLYAFLSSLTFSSAVQADETTDEQKLQIGGYYKNLFVTSQLSDTDEDFFSDMNRLRLEFKKQIDPWQFYLTLDNEAIVNDFGNSPDFDLIRSKSQNDLAAWDLDKTSADYEHMYLRHSIYRAYVKYYSPEFQTVLGKQSIDWGKMRFYSPLDVFNPTGPIDLEPEERVGVDAVNFNFSPENFANINAVVAPGEDAGETSFGLRLSKTISPYDLAITAASIKKDVIVGFSFEGAVKDAGFRGEVSQTWMDNGRSFPRVSVGMDYNFTSKVYVLVEQFFNGGHDDNNIAAYSSSYRFARQILSVKEHLTSTMVKYSLTALTEISTALIYDWDGKSVVVNPQIKYNITPNIDLSAGTQLFYGDNNSEFGNYEHLFYVEFKWFF